jgi:hypothetical protein
MDVPRLVGTVGEGAEAVRIGHTVESLTGQ